ncbi:MAG: tetratricopeptide repeat protein [Terriglobia bacterium]|jgi:tetratricopeptide (TPR) repeat protein
MKYLVLLGAVMVALAGECVAAQPKRAQGASAARPASLTIDYPLEGSIFPPEITPPTFIWHDSAESATYWRIGIAFADGSALIKAESAGERLTIGTIDPRCASSTNELPKLPPEQASAHTWIPEVKVWEKIKKHSAAGAAVVTISGFSGPKDRRTVSSGRVTIVTSRDPTGAPIFYRDVPLMPTQTEKGIIMPLALDALHLIQWRLRDISKTESRVVLTDVPTCINCHSFSRDGKTLGMDLDGPLNDKGLYAIVPIKPQMTVRNEDVISWSSIRDTTASTSRIGFMSQVSPDGKYILTNYRGQTKNLGNGYFTVNYKDYRFAQVFYPTRSIVAWYDRATGVKQPLPGADDPAYVQTNAVWSPDGKYVVFARAVAMDPYTPGMKMPEYANDPNEPQIQYNLYWVPFNDGKGGRAQPVAGASHNGMSNSFPKVSPDGRWIVWVKCRNGQLMRPDSQLYMVPAPSGGVARRMNCNTSLMNSWHSFSPNGRWLVFSSKSRSPYTQMYLTHIDEQGNDSPAILIDNATAANRAVNIPEFVNIPQDQPMAISTPAIDMYKEIDRVAQLESQGQLDAAVTGWNSLLANHPDEARIHYNLGTALTQAGRPAEAVPEFEKALELKYPSFSTVYLSLGRALLLTEQTDRAIAAFEKGLEYDLDSADLHSHLGLALANKNLIDEAKSEFDRSLQINPNNANAHFALGIAFRGWGDGEGAIKEFRETLRLDPKNELAHVNLATALRQKGDLDGAIGEYRAAVLLSPSDEIAHVNLGLALGTKGDWDGAISEEREALRLAPKDGAVCVYLGALLGQRGDQNGAIAELREALQLNPSNTLAHYDLGVALEKQGDRQAALQEYRAAYQLDPNTPPYRQAYERLSHLEK